MNATDTIFNKAFEKIKAQKEKERRDKKEKPTSSEPQKTRLLKETTGAMESLERLIGELFSNDSRALAFILSLTPIHYTQIRKPTSLTTHEDLTCRIFAISIHGTFCIAMKVPFKALSDTIERPFALCLGTLHPDSKETFSPINLSIGNIDAYSFLRPLIEKMLTPESFFEIFLRTNLP